MKTRKGVQHRSNSKTSKLLKIFLSWFQEEPVNKRSHIRRSGSLQRPSYVVGKPKVWMWCCWTVCFVLFIRYAIMRHSETLPISILDDSRIQSERSLVKDDVMFALDGDLEHRNPNPAIMSPSDRDMAYIETPRINLKKWAESFKSCFFEQKLNNEFKF